MKRIRRGNDINLLWEIIHDVAGESKPYELIGKDLSLYLQTPFGKEAVDDFSIQGNVISWTFKGKNQKYAGRYSLTLVVNDVEQTIDECNAFELVSHSCQVGGEDDNEQLKIETLSFVSRLDIAAIIPDTEINANSQNVVTNAAIADSLAKKVSKTDVATINGQSLIEGGNIVIEGKNYDDVIESLSEQTESLETEIESQNEMIEDLQNTKIDKEADDYYPQLSVGLADNLAGTDVVEGAFTLRRSGGGAIEDGVARVQSIKGNSVVWNQLVADNNITASDSEITSTDNGYSIVPIGSYPGVKSIKTIEPIKGHKYILLCTKTGGSKNIYVNWGGKNGSIGSSPIFEVTDTSTKYLGVYSYNETETFSITTPRLCDLTKMFGAGNEPTTIEEFYARIPSGVNLNEHTEGTIINMNVDSLKSVGFNQWDEEWEVGYIDESGVPAVSPNYIRSKNFIPVIPNEKYYIGCPNAKLNIYQYDSLFNYLGKVSQANITYVVPSNVAYIKFRNYNPEYGTTYNHDICINISDAEKNGTYEPYISREQSLAMVQELFPNGMRSAGSAHDEVRFNKQSNRWEKREIKQTNMWELNWSAVGSNAPNVFHATIADITKPSSSNDYLDGLLCSRYTISTNASVFTMDDMSMLRYNGYVYVKDSSCANIAELKSALQDIIFYYEPSEEEWVEIDDTFNLDYEVWNGGTEQAIAEGASSPLKAEIAYGFNAVGKIKELEEKVNNGVGGGVSKEYVDNAIASAITNELNGDF